VHRGNAGDGASPAAAPVARPKARGKFLFLGDEKFWPRGVSYGTFRPDADGNEYRPPDLVERDFALMAASGLNAIRTYTVPPRWLLDAAQRYGLRVMVGLPWEQHVTFLDDKERARSIAARVRAGVRACAGHPAVLCFAIGNEIPAPIVRWHGSRRIERYIERLYHAAKCEDSDALVTYVSYPTTEYLQLPFLDIVSFNVYLEARERLEAYLARLHNLAGDRPLILTEVGLDSRRHGERTQAKVLEWQIRSSFGAGCAAVFVFSWTDEWYRGGHDIHGWDFGLTRRDGRAKPALAAVREAVAEVPFPKDRPWPRISVAVCSHNGARTIRDCFDGLLRLRYPNFEAIVVDDGSTDQTPAIAQEYGFRLISTRNKGLSSARNTALAAADGEVVAYIDDDAWPDPDWLTYLAASFMSTDHVGVGGPNIPPPDDGVVAEAVANAPGGPIHVLLSDREAEHIPGCNMAFRKEALEAIGGFDPQFWTAGDDVDVCWRLQQRGWTLGFHPGAMVWHRRRNSIRAYWRQQRGYGRAEALLERKWPEKYNAGGHVTWTGRIYGNGLARVLGKRVGRIYHGTWGSALFQSIYEPAPGMFSSLYLMPEWYLVIAALAGLSALGLSWRPLLLGLPLLAVGLAAPVGHAIWRATRLPAGKVPFSPTARLKSRALTALLHLVQPIARLEGRLRSGLTPWRRGAGGCVWPRVRTAAVWSERWRASTEWLQSLEAALRGMGARVIRGGDYDQWDLEVRGGVFGAVRVHMAIEEHGAGRQLVRFRASPRCSREGLLTTALFALCAGALLNQAFVAGTILGTTATMLAALMFRQCAGALACVLDALGLIKETTS
jgi:GT2 family glycosyltransferase